MGYVIIQNTLVSCCILRCMHLRVRVFVRACAHEGACDTWRQVCGARAGGGGTPYPPLQVAPPRLAGARGLAVGGVWGYTWWGVRGKGRAVDSGITQVTRGPSLTLRLAAARFTLAA